MIKAFLITLITLTAGYVFGYDSPYIDTNPGTPEYHLLFEENEYLLMESSLIASGVNESELGGYVIKFKNFDSELKNALDYTNDYKLASTIFERTHDRLLDDYEAEVYTINSLLDYQNYNQVSASILLIAIMELNDFDVRLAVFDDHVYPVVKIDDEWVEIETTTLLGFDIAENERAKKTLKQKMKVEYRPYTEALELIESPLIPAYIYYYRSKDDMEANLFQNSFQNALKAYALYPDGVGFYDQLILAYVDYTDELIDTGKQFSTAVEILENAIVNISNDNRIISEYKKAIEKYLYQKINNGYYETALTIFNMSTNITDLPLTNVQKNMYFEIIFKLINQETDYDQAFTYASNAIKLFPNAEIIKSAVLDGMESVVDRQISKWDTYPDGEMMVMNWYSLLDSDNMDILMAEYYSEIAEMYNNTGDYETALDIIDIGLEILPGNENLNEIGANIAKTIAESYGNEENYEKEIEYLKLALEYDSADQAIWDNLSTAYNNWKQLYTVEKQWEKANEIVTEGLELMPEDEGLLNTQQQLKNFLK